MKNFFVVGHWPFLYSVQQQIKETQAHVNSYELSAVYHPKYVKT